MLLHRSAVQELGDLVGRLQFESLPYHPHHSRGEDGSLASQVDLIWAPNVGFFR